MPRDLFGDVTHPSASIGNRKWYTVPVSLLSHSVIVAIFLVLPIIAAPLMPAILDGDDSDYLIEILPPPPPPITRPTRLKPMERPGVAPITAPDSIAAENPALPDFSDQPWPGVIGGSDQLEHVLGPPPALPTRTQPPAPVRVGGVIRQPQKIRTVDPVYSPMAQAARIQGLVIIEATIGADGRVMNARILRSLPMLDRSALDAVKQWEFTPTLLNGVPVPVIMTVVVNFTLR